MAATAIAAVVPTEHTPRPGLCALVMIGGDLAAAALSLTVAVLLRYVFDGRFDLEVYLRPSISLLLFVAGYALFGLYPGVGQNPVREIRQLSQATTLVFVLYATLLFLFKVGGTYSRIVFLIGWILALVLVPLARTMVRRWFGSCVWWGYPVAVFGSGETAQNVVSALQKQPELGLHPVAIFHEEEAGWTSIPGVPICGDFRSAPLYAKRLGLNHAIIAVPGIVGPGLVQLLETHANVFRRVFVIPGLDEFSSFDIETRDICNSVTLELRRSLLDPANQFCKRVIDQTLSLLLGILLLPVMLAVVVIIRLESPGSALFFHRRIGHGGRQFRMWKFRTMRQDGNRILQEYLRQHPEEEAEWKERRKLRNDPRVTRVGRILRKTSLDELPQLWNVLRGDMSLVGPRPIVADEAAKYSSWFDHYCRVVPGLTGLWQVSGRSDTDYKKRVALDSYYVRNWSPWFDIYLLARTVRVVFKGEGAY
jgi:Undecaprenyl-phosphate galactose phosphotransferase WbaP